LGRGGFPQNLALLESVRRFASARTIEVFAREVHGLSDLAPAFDDAAQAGSEAVIFLTDSLMFGHRKEVAELALGHRLPSMHSFGAEVQDGGLMFYGPSLAESYRRSAALADRILRGARAGDLPVGSRSGKERMRGIKVSRGLACGLGCGNRSMAP
jgi:putative tryptophan/tyrosine transport system substrate-binding protein